MSSPQKAWPGFLVDTGSQRKGHCTGAQHTPRSVGKGGGEAELETFSSKSQALDASLKDRLMIH